MKPKIKIATRSNPLVYDDSNILEIVEEEKRILELFEEFARTEGIEEKIRIRMLAEMREFFAMKKAETLFRSKLEDFSLNINKAVHASCRALITRKMPETSELYDHDIFYFKRTKHTLAYE